LTAVARFDAFDHGAKREVLFLKEEAFALTTSQSASLAARGEVKRGNHFMEPKAHQTCGGEAPTARSGFFTRGQKQAAATRPNPYPGKPKNISAATRVGIRAAANSGPAAIVPLGKVAFKMANPAGFGALAITVSPPPVTAPATSM